MAGYMIYSLDWNGFRQFVESPTHEQLLAAAEVQDWRPVIDSVRPLDEAAAAHARIEAGEHFGKLVLTTA